MTNDDILFAKLNEAEKMTYNEFIQSIIDTRGQWNIADGEYFEMHHIIPACLGGSSDTKNKRFYKRSHNSNCIWLSAKEHFIAHQLLAQENPENIGLVYGFWAMCTVVNKTNQERYQITAEEYNMARQLLYKNCSGNKHYSYGKHLTEEQKQALSKAHIGKGLGHIYVNHPEFGAKSISKEELQSYLNNGWRIGNGQNGKKVSDETKKLISERTKAQFNNWKINNPDKYEKWRKTIGQRSSGRKLSAEAKEKISIKNSGKNNGMYKDGKHSKAYKLKHKRVLKPVICIETGIVYKTASEAARLTGFGASHISRCCLHTYGFKTVGGYHWEFIKNDG